MPALAIGGLAVALVLVGAALDRRNVASGGLLLLAGAIVITGLAIVGAVGPGFFLIPTCVFAWFTVWSAGASEQADVPV